MWAGVAASARVWMYMYVRRVLRSREMGIEKEEKEEEGKESRKESPCTPKQLQVHGGRRREGKRKRV